jgi:hypothetical protein
MSGSLRAVVTTPNGKHTHGFSTSWKGGSEGHSHGIYSDGAHTHPVSMNATPPYYALAFLVRRIPVETAEEGGS